GNLRRTRWWNYPPLSELAFSPDVGVDYYLWPVQISGIGTLLTGINFVTTILKLRAPGMTYFRMPVFCWTALATNLMIVAAGPSRGLHSRSTGVRHLFRSGRDVFRQGAVQLPLDGLGNAWDLCPLSHGLAASLFHYGRGR